MKRPTIRNSLIQTGNGGFEIAYQRVRKDLKGKKILEICAGNGSFIKRLLDFSAKENILATEFSEIGRNAIESLGVPCVSLNLTDDYFLQFKEAFDYIFCFQGLEHLDQLDAFFERVRFLLKKGGKVIFTVPNSNQRFLILQHGIVLDMPPTHTTMWFKKSWQAVEKQHGLKLVEHCYENASRLEFYRKASRLIYGYKLEKSSNRVLKTIKKMQAILLAFPLFVTAKKTALGTSQFVLLEKAE